MLNNKEKPNKINPEIDAINMKQFQSHVTSGTFETLSNHDDDLKVTTWTQKGLEREHGSWQEKWNLSSQPTTTTTLFLTYKGVDRDLLKFLTFSAVMTSFKELRELLLVCHDQGMVSDEEFWLLFDLYESKKPDSAYDSYPVFVLQGIDEAECVVEFRFRKRDIPLLADKLQIPPNFICKQRCICDGITGLCMLLRHLSYLCRYGDMIQRFARPVPILSMITNDVLDYIYDLHGHRITRWNDAVMNPPQLQRYADAIAAKGSPLDNCFGFVDGTVIPICRPGQNQRLMYNGCKRVHGIKFQSLALQNGIIGNMYGPVEGKKHDAGMLANSGLLQDLQRFAVAPTGQLFCVYGDPAYPSRVQLQGPFKNAVLTPQMQAYNASMSRVRILVEWLFGDIMSYFKFIYFKKDLKLYLNSVGKMHVVCAILRNALTCLYGNQTSSFFDLDPTTLQEYFV